MGILKCEMRAPQFQKQENYAYTSIVSFSRSGLLPQNLRGNSGTKKNTDNAKFQEATCICSILIGIGIHMPRCIAYVCLFIWARKNNKS